MEDELLNASFRRVNARFFEGLLDERSYKFWWKELSRTYGRVTYGVFGTRISVHSKLKGDSELLDYVMLHELLHTVRGFRGVRRHRGKFNERMRELLGEAEFRRFEARLHAVDIRKRLFRKVYVYECPNCLGGIIRKRRIKDSSCAKCDKRYNPEYRLKLVGMSA